MGNRKNDEKREFGMQLVVAVMVKFGIRGGKSFTIRAVGGGPSVLIAVSDLIRD
jgi:hypothetical protein